MSFGVKQKQRNTTWQQILVEESDLSLRNRGVKRRRTFRRMYLTVFVWFPVLVLLYSSLFYVGAFVDPGGVVGTSHAKRAASAKTNASSLQITKKRNFLSPLANAFAVNKVYLREGQSIQLSYALPKGTQLTARIKQCKSFPVIEVFKCKFVSTQEQYIRFSTTGAMKFTASAAGFYYFEDQVIKLPTTILTQDYDYKVVWQRS